MTDERIKEARQLIEVGAQPIVQAWNILKQLEQGEDTEAPVASNVTVMSTTNSITVTFDTDEPSMAKLSCPGFEAVDNELDTKHALVLKGLDADTPYQCSLRLEDSKHNVDEKAWTGLVSTKANANTNLAREVSQFGITWTFDKPYPVGQFAGGCWWAAGPVKIIGISPDSKTGTRIKNGTMINPSPKSGTVQGFDNNVKHNGYNSALNVAENVSVSNPLFVDAGSSLVSSITFEEAYRNKSQIQAHAILTILDAPAPKGSFRPAYSGTDKSIQFNADQIKYELLEELETGTKTPDITKVADYFERPWVDHIPGWGGAQIHAVQSMPHYGRDMSSRIGEAALMLHLDVAGKETLAIRFIQLGIDLYGITQDGGGRNWMNNGGHASGRKWPIIFAGIMLGHKGMMEIAKEDIWFGEDMQTWFVTQSDVGRELKPDTRAPKALYQQSDVGKAEWGIRHETNPISDNAHWLATYRQCCTGNAWLGFVLAARIMKAQELWDHDALFAYEDRYIPESRRQGDKEWMTSWSPWVLEMWDKHRAKF